MCGFGNCNESKKSLYGHHSLLQSFTSGFVTHFRPILVQVIAENLSEEEIMGLKEMFKSMDTDNSGTITYEELKAGLPKLGTKISESEVRQLMEAVMSLILKLKLFTSTIIIPFVKDNYLYLS